MHACSRTPRTVPAPVSGQLGLGEEQAPGTTSASYRAFSAPVPNENMDVLPPNSPDSSDMGMNDDDSLSNLSEAREINNTGPCSPVGSARRTFPPAETIDRLELGSTSDKNSANSVPPAPRPGSRTGPPSRQGSAMSGRPGSDRHPVLPPISPKPVDPLPAY